MMIPLRIYGVIIVISLVLSIILLFVNKPYYQPVNVSHYSPPKIQEKSPVVLENKLKTLYRGVQTFVLFIGYARSGHSLVGAILDAHPNIVIPHEFNVIDNWNYYTNKSKGNSDRLKNRLFFDLHALSREQAMFGNRASNCPRGNYCYHVAGQWQGTYRDKIKVIGDKKGTSISSFLSKSTENFHVLEEMQRALKIPLKFIHVIRNPFDNIATKVLRQLHARDSARDVSFKVNSSFVLDKVITRHFQLVDSAQKLHQHGKYEVLDIYGYEIIANPQDNLKKLCNFLQVANDKEYIDAASKLLYSKLTKTRHSIVWTSEQIATVTNEMKKYPFMRPFTFDSN